MPRHKIGDLIGGWKLIASLGEGGNAEVWRVSDGKEEVALKVLHQHKTGSEPYRRFRQEIEALTQIGANPCVMPLLGKDLPETPSSKSPAWLAMPIGIPLSDSLSHAPLRSVVAAIGEIAETLADLHERLGIHHRDIKPSNLYMLDGHAVISDFGLVDLLEADDLTADGRPLGPKYFLAYEMIVNPKESDPAPADVFSLAKTLWVLSTDQHWPPQGEQHASNDAYSIGNLRPHPLSRHLDELIERCTHHEPQARPAMKQVAEDLRAWQNLEQATPQKALELSATWSRLREVAEPSLRQAHEREMQRQSLQSATRQFQELLNPLFSDIRRQYPAASFDQRHKLVETLFRTSYNNDVILEDYRSTILSGPGGNPIRLIIGTAVRVTASSELEIGGLFFVGHTETMGHADYWVSTPRRLACGSITAEAALVEIAAKMQTEFPGWLDKFTDELEIYNA